MKFNVQLGMIVTSRDLEIITGSLVAIIVMIVL